MGRFMKRTPWIHLAIIVAIAGIVAPGAAQNQFSTAILSSEQPAISFAISATDGPASTGNLTFEIPPVPKGATFSKCTLRVVPMPHPGPTDQDVTIRWDLTNVGQWSAYHQTVKPFTADLRPEACTPGSKIFTLMTPSRHNSWNYYGSAAANSDLEHLRGDVRPRLILTYNVPPPVRWGQSTDWKYPLKWRLGCNWTDAGPSCQGDSFDSLWSQLPGDLLANPVSYADGVWAIVDGAPPKVYELTGPKDIRNWPVPIPIYRDSFALVTAQGQLRIITKGAVVHCDLTSTSTSMLLCGANYNDKISVNPGETPAIAADGTLYFKNAAQDGRIVALNSSGQVIWRTALKLTAVSPIALSANGRHAYVLANISSEGSQTRTTRLLGIDTATGETTATEIVYRDNHRNEVKPSLNTLLRPAVATKQSAAGKESVDYVFVAGNSNDKGILQLVVFAPRKPPTLLWTRVGEKLLANPILSVKDDGNSLFVVQHVVVTSPTNMWEAGALKRYTWYSRGARLDRDMEATTLRRLNREFIPALPPAGETLLVDGSDAIYINGSFTGVCDVAPFWGEVGCGFLAYHLYSPSPAMKLFFGPRGALIGYRDRNIYDLSPKFMAIYSRAPTVQKLEPWTIYSADSLILASPPDKTTPVILKGNDIKLPDNFSSSLFPGVTVIKVPK